MGWTKPNLITSLAQQIKLSCEHSKIEEKREDNDGSSLFKCGWVPNVLNGMHVAIFVSYAMSIINHYMANLRKVQWEYEK